MAYWLSHDHWPSGLCVCHSCDNPGCVNPEHFFLGTRADNRHDCVMKGRHARGERNGRTVLTKQQVREIVTLGKSMSRRDISQTTGCSESVVNNILSGRCWSNVTGIQCVATGRRGTSNGRSVLSEADVLRIVRLRALGHSYGRVAELIGCGKHLVYQICSGKNWSWLTGIKSNGRYYADSLQHPRGGMPATGTCRLALHPATKPRSRGDGVSFSESRSPSDRPHAASETAVLHAGAPGNAGGSSVLIAYGPKNVSAPRNSGLDRAFATLNHPNRTQDRQ